MVVVIPSGFDRSLIPTLVSEHQTWIDRALAEVNRRRALQGRSDERPERIDLQAVGRSWEVEWITGPGSQARVVDLEDVLQVVCPVDDRSAWRKALRRWLVDRGREYLIPMVEESARDLGIRLSKISIRCQKTRWGSYTSRGVAPGAVSLNAQLLFLPLRLMRYVLIHELCHAKHPNHSDEFWRAVRVHIPDVDARRAEIRQAWKYVPGWLVG